MIEVLPIEKEYEIEKFYNSINLNYSSHCGVTVAKEHATILGYCTYSLDAKSITITSIKPTDDLFLADGILRSALHVADFHGITEAFFTDSVDRKLLSMLKFIDDEEKNTLNIQKLHESCCSCGN